jgi:hypothetical protein
MKIEPADMTKKKLERFTLIEDAERFFNDRLQGCFKRSATLDSVAQTELSRFCQFDSPRVISILKDTSVQSEETLCFTLGSLFFYAFFKGNLRFTTNSISDHVFERITTPNRMIRMFAAINGDPATPDATIMLKAYTLLSNFL